MKLASFLIEGRPCFGLIKGDCVYNLSAEYLAVPDLKSLLANFPDTAVIKANLESTPYYSLDEVQLLPVIPNPEKIICVGLNYESHRLETGMPEMKHPVLFTRFASTQIAHGAPIVRPNISEKLDFEGELAVIIGRAGRHITRESAFQHVAGYACYNDASIRDWQMHTGQFTPGKNFYNTGAFGPWMVTPDEIDDLESQTLTTRLNGEQVQHAPFSDLIFNIPALIEYISTFCTLVAGDVIVTGTPGGVGVKRKPRLYMKPGDVIEVEISGVGVLRNPIVQESLVGL
jgi:2-keto-4-pentenoate hydratase/2-oxohepta-3-ene-1,7-dioic acid hydratase in catechol pathway